MLARLNLYFYVITMKGKLIVIISLLSLSTAFLALSSSQESAQPHYQLHEFQEKLVNDPSALKQRYMTVYGNVEEGSITRAGGKANFVIIDNDKNRLKFTSTEKHYYLIPLKMAPKPRLMAPTIHIPVSSLLTRLWQSVHRMSQQSLA